MSKVTEIINYILDRLSTEKNQQAPQSEDYNITTCEAEFLFYETENQCHDFSVMRFGECHVYLWENGCHNLYFTNIILSKQL